MNRRDLLKGNGSNWFYYLIIFVVICFLYFNIMSNDFLDIREINKIEVYSNEGEYMGDNYMRVIDNDYIKYSESAYDYLSEIHEEDYVIKGEFKIESMKELGYKYLIKTHKISGSKNIKDTINTYRQANIYISKDKIDNISIKKLTDGTKIYIEGELNNISDYNYVINDVEVLEVR